MICTCKKSLNNIIIIFFYIRDFLFTYYTMFAFLSNTYSNTYYLTHKYIIFVKIKKNRTNLCNLMWKEKK